MGDVGDHHPKLEAGYDVAVSQVGVQLHRVAAGQAGEGHRGLGHGDGRHHAHVHADFCQRRRSVEGDGDSNHRDSRLRVQQTTLRISASRKVHHVHKKKFFGGHSVYRFNLFTNICLPAHFQLRVNVDINPQSRCLICNTLLPNTGLTLLDDGG